LDQSEEMRTSILISGLVAFGVAGLVTVAPAQSNQEKSPTMPTVNVIVQHFDNELEVKYPWGWIRWMMNSQIEHDSAQTFGIVQINPGHHNFLHSHPNCEEILYVLSGSGEHIVGDKKVLLHAGDLIRVPAGVPHQVFVLGNEPLRAVISYSSGDREVVNYGNTE
jgi:mannose-6-phosphate isomerase-like protein (cupin superfamily)